MPVRSSPFHANDMNNKPSRNFCVSYAQSTRNGNFNPTIHEQQEEIYSSLKKVRNPNDENLLLLPPHPTNFGGDKHVTMIPLGSPHELHREVNSNGTIIRVVANENGGGVGGGGNEKVVPEENFTEIFRKQPENKKEFEGWSGKAMEGRVIRGTNKIRGYWERNIQMEERSRAEEERRQRPRSYGFPKWRSTDALSASLVASNSIQIPIDSRIPEERLRKMEETEREAVEVKKEIHEEADMMAGGGGGSSRKLSKGKSLDSLNMQVDHRPWYDAEKIKSAVSRESIANIATSREFFENASQRDWRSGTNSRRDSMCSLSIAPPLPPKSEIVQLRQSRPNGGYPHPQNVLTISSGYDNNTQPAPSSSSIQVQIQNQNPIQHQPPPPTTIQSYHHHHHQPPTSRYEQQPAVAPQKTSINRLIQQDSPQTADPIEQQEVLLMLYLKQNMDIAQSLGLQIPQDLLAEMDDLQMLPVELRICDEEPHRMFSPVMKNGGRYQQRSQNNHRQIGGGGGGAAKFVASKRSADPRQELNEQIRTRSRQNSEMTNSNLDLSYNFPSSYGYHHQHQNQ